MATTVHNISPFEGLSYVPAGTGANLPTLTAADAGTRSIITDANNSVTWGSAVSGNSGTNSNVRPVYWSGAAWLYG